MSLRTLIAAALVVVATAAPAAAAGEQVCIPGANGYVTILGKEYRLPVGHSLPCQDLP
jgi:hypothetical protein